MEDKKPQMIYRQLGKSGLKVSAISYGFMDVFSQEHLTSLVKYAYENGINFFDNAELYGGFGKEGLVETLFGNALKELKIPRQDLVISTKIFWGGKGVNDVGLSRKHLIEGTNNSLQRLQLDYVDLLLAHRPDFDTPLEETCRAFDWLVKNGKTLYWGTSEWPAKRIWEAIGICEKYNLEKPIVEQPQYNMFVREKMEKEYVELFDTYGLGTTIWSPLAGGILTGKYNREISSDSRYKTAWFGSFSLDKYLSPENIDNTRKILLPLEDLAKELGCNMAQLALAWTIKNKDVSTALIGSTKISQLEDNLKSLQVLDKITPEIEAKIEAILKTKPIQEQDPKNFMGKLKDRR